MNLSQADWIEDGGDLREDKFIGGVQYGDWRRMGSSYFWPFSKSGILKTQQQNLDWVDEIVIATEQTRVYSSQEALGFYSDKAVAMGFNARINLEVNDDGVDGVRRCGEEDKRGLLFDSWWTEKIREG